MVRTWCWIGVLVAAAACGQEQKADNSALNPMPELVNAPNRCLANPGREYVVHVPSGGKVRVDLSGAPGIYSVAWMDPRTGVREEGSNLLGGAPRTLPAPDANPWVLQLRRKPDGISGSGVISWKVPEDGGTPRDPNRIVRLAEKEFLMLACSEEPQSFLRHAVSRLDLVCENHGTAAESVTLHLDLSGDGSREKLDRDGKGFGGMPRRNYIYIQTAGGPWRRIDGSVQGWVCTVSVPAIPGKTRIGLSPWYPYADYLRFVDTLPEHPHLTRAVVGKSDGGRPLWELTITDPAVPAERKQRIFWHTREHAYETFGSFAMEGLVAFLLSPEADEFRKQFVISLHPMTNVDGVAQGSEYRTGYDFPKPRESAIAKLTWGAIDRLRPHLVVTWHNWIAPRDVDVVFFTDDEEGKPSRRAWDLFTQRFPSPRSVGHRWSNETDPLKHNYFGRTLSDDNVHQYALKHYGTKVWGWEMPWWGRDEGDPAAQARQLGADFARALLSVQRDLAAPSGKAAAESPVLELALGMPHEFVVQGQGLARSVIVGDFVSSSGKIRQAEGVPDGGKGWRLSFTPDEEGEWSYLLRGEGIEYFSRGRLRCLKRP